jgi:membrane-bound lytic murein transglycosylase A
MIRAQAPARSSSINLLVSAAAAAAIGVCALLPATAAGEQSEPLRMPDTQFEPVAWNELQGWGNDDHLASFGSFLISCRPLVNGNATAAVAPVLHDALRETCRKALRAKPRDAAEARAFFEQNFRPARIAKLGENAGFLTGYYEPIVEGSRFPSDEYTVPVYRRPANLIASGRSRQTTKSFPNKGKVGRLIGRRKLVPYYDRGEIEDGVLAGRELEICWLKNRIDLFFIQIQGSARVRLDDGKMLRLNYDGHNGWPYTPVGRILIEKGIVPRDEMSMDRIREWMQANPDEAKELRRKNQSYVFFREVRLGEGDEAVGGQGVPLTPGRSIAVDRPLHAYGTLFFIEADLPIASGREHSKFQRLMVAQDTGSAIVGPARADIYFGAGSEPGRVAGRIRHSARFAVLIPRELDPVKAGAVMPLPRAKPPIVEEIPEATVPLPRPRPDTSEPPHAARSEQ